MIVILFSPLKNDNITEKVNEAFEAEDMNIASTAL